MFDIHRWSLMFADDNDAGDGDDGDKGGGDKGAETDIDKLRSAKDTEIAALDTQLKETRAKLEELTTTIAGQKQSNETVTAVQTLIDGVDMTDPVKAAGALKDLALQIGGRLATVASEKAGYERAYKDEYASRIADGIAFAHGGNAETYKARLLKSNTRDDMNREAELIRSQVAKSTPNPRNDNNNNGRGNRVDNNDQSRAVNRDVISEMNAIDVRTPEGRAEFEKREREIKAKVDAASR